MNIGKKLLAAALATALLLALGAGTSFALRSISLEGETRLTLTGTFTAESESFTIRCNVTVVKTVSRLIPKIEGTLVGRITDYRVANCTTTTGTLNSVTPVGVAAAELWRIFYKEFLGTLPSITGLLFEWRNVQKLFGIRLIVNNGCLYEGTVGLLARVRPEGIIERLRSLDERPETIEKLLHVTLEGICPRKIRLRYELTPLQNTRIRLL